MTGRTLLLILLSVSLSGFAQVAFKFGVSAYPVRSVMEGGSMVRIAQALLSSPGVIIGLAMYGVGTLLWLNVLSRTQLSLVYPFVALSFIITAVLGSLLFHETVNANRLLGTALVIVGVILVGRG